MDTLKSVRKIGYAAFGWHVAAALALATMSIVRDLPIEQALFAIPSPRQSLPEQNVYPHELRCATRYPVELNLKYRLATAGDALGCGRTLNISSKGLLFEAFDDFESNLGSAIELYIDWPILLNDACALKFVVGGKIIRSRNTCFAVATLRYEFRTAAVTSGCCEPGIPSTLSSCSRARRGVR